MSLREFRIPLPGALNGIVLLVPDRPLTAAQWAHFLSVLDVFRPGLVEHEAAAADARCPTCKAHRDDLNAVALLCSDGFHAPAVSLQPESETA